MATKKKVDWRSGVLPTVTVKQGELMRHLLEDVLPRIRLTLEGTRTSLAKLLDELRKADFAACMEAVERDDREHRELEALRLKRSAREERYLDIRCRLDKLERDRGRFWGVLASFPWYRRQLQSTEAACERALEEVQTLHVEIRTRERALGEAQHRSSLDEELEYRCNHARQLRSSYEALSERFSQVSVVYQAVLKLSATLVEDPLEEITVYRRGFRVGDGMILFAMVPRAFAGTKGFVEADELAVKSLGTVVKMKGENHEDASTREF